MKTKYSITGHETFACRNFWLKKGFDFEKGTTSFSDKDAVVKLGVGKNMVNSIRHWLKAFGFNNQKQDANLLEKIFNDIGFDPYLEDINTLWLLHYFLIKNKNASIYDLFFNKFNPRGEFSFLNFEYFLKSKFEEENFSYSPKSLENDLKVFQAMYIRPDRSVKSLEDEYTGLFHDLSLFDIATKDQVFINRSSAKTISPYIALFVILDQFENSVSISFNNLFNQDNSIGKVFCLNQNSMHEIIEELTETFDFLIFKEDAGVKELQIKNRRALDKNSIIEKYYEQN